MNRITSLLGIKYPIIQGGMVWCSGWKLASAVSNHGGLGLLGAGSMHPDTLLEHINKMKSATQKPWGVNVPLLYPKIDEIIDLIIKNDVKIVFTSAGNPAIYTSVLKSHGITVVHVIANTKFAKKCEEACVDAIVAEGFEAGGHNGNEETTTFTLIPTIKKVTSLPLIAAGGISTGESMLAAMVLGADGVQIGSRFAISDESSAHINFKNLVISLGDGDTKLALKKIGAVRLIKNQFFAKVNTLEHEGASVEQLKELLGKGRCKKGIFEGDLDEGELEIGQVASIINSIESVETIMNKVLASFNIAKEKLNSPPFCF